jgi:hypothetical protein
VMFRLIWWRYDSGNRVTTVKPNGSTEEAHAPQTRKWTSFQRAVVPISKLLICLHAKVGVDCPAIVFDIDEEDRAVLDVADDQSVCVVDLVSPHRVAWWTNDEVECIAETIVEECVVGCEKRIAVWSVVLAPFEDFEETFGP